jgi:hypothetical protein
MDGDGFSRPGSERIRSFWKRKGWLYAFAVLAALIYLFAQSAHSAVPTGTSTQTTTRTSTNGFPVVYGGGGGAQISGTKGNSGSNDNSSSDDGGDDSGGGSDGGGGGDGGGGDGGD